MTTKGGQLSTVEKGSIFGRRWQGGQAANATGRRRACSRNRCRRVVAMQANLEPAGRRDGRVLERLGQATGPSQAAVGDLNAPGVPDGPEDRLPVVPPHSADLEVVGWAEGTGRGRLGRLGRGRRIRWSRRRTPGGVSMTIIEGVSSVHVVDTMQNETACAPSCSRPVVLLPPRLGLRDGLAVGPLPAAVAGDAAGGSDPPLRECQPVPVVSDNQSLRISP